MTCMGPGCKECVDSDNEEIEHELIRYKKYPDKSAGGKPQSTRPSRACSAPFDNCLEPEEPQQSIINAVPVLPDREWTSAELEGTREPQALVTLHVYDLGQKPSVSSMNSVLRVLGTGAYHTAIEVYDREWSFGHPAGVFGWSPGDNDHHNYREPVTLGFTLCTPSEVESIVEQLKVDWLGSSYHIQRCNCNHFCDDFSKRLGVGPVPFWVKSLSAPKKRPKVTDDPRRD